MAKRNQVSASLRYSIFERDGFTCQYCGRKAPEVELQADHIVPKAAGGDSEPSNLITSCVECNTGKSSKLTLRPIDNDRIKGRVKSLRERKRLLKECRKNEKAVEEAWDERTWDSIRFWLRGFGKEPRDKENWTTSQSFYNFIRAKLVKHSYEEMLNSMSIAIGRFAHKNEEEEAQKYLGGILRTIHQRREDGILQEGE
ncbi:MAG: HNH endonuclease [Phycisphaerae bacterium]|nr:HNH endonuclease [Phycisphaerae bacterium]